MHNELITYDSLVATLKIAEIPMLRVRNPIWLH
jgi:hypothetical protein